MYGMVEQNGTTIDQHSNSKKMAIHHITICLLSDHILEQIFQKS